MQFGSFGCWWWATCCFYSLLLCRDSQNLRLNLNTTHHCTYVRSVLLTLSCTLHLSVKIKDCGSFRDTVGVQKWQDRDTITAWYLAPGTWEAVVLSCNIVLIWRKKSVLSSCKAEWLWGLTDECDGQSTCISLAHTVQINCPWMYTYYWVLILLVSLVSFVHLQFQ